MKLLSVHITSFGKLRNVDLNFADGINILTQKNGFGKTTLAAFIRAMLYGFKYTSAKFRTSEKVTDASRWATWNTTEKIGGSMKVLQNGEILIIERFFGAKQSQETLTVVRQSTGESVEMQNSVGEALLGLTAESFDRSAYFPQEAVELSTNENFDTRLAGLVQNAEDFSKVTKSLDEYRKKLKLQKGSGGLIDELENKKMQLSQNIFECSSAEKRQNEIDNSLAEIDNQKTQLVAATVELTTRAEQLQNRLAQARPTKKQLENAEKLRQLESKLSRLDGFEEDYKTCTRIAENVQNTPTVSVKRRFSPLLFVIGLALIAAGCGLCFWQLYVGLSALAAGAICFAVSFFAGTSVKTLSSNDHDALISQYFDVASKYVFCQNLSYDEVQRKMWQFYADYVADCRERDALASSVPVEQSTEPISAQLNQTKAQLEVVQQKLRQLSREEGSLSAERAALNTDSTPFVEQLAEADLQLSQAKKQLATVQTVTELLLRAKQNLSVSYLPKLSARCGQLLNAVTGGTYQVLSDRNFSVQLCENGITKPLDYFSRGLREVTMLCFRLALSEMLFGGKIPLLIIDDAFVNFDDENFLRATQLLRQMSDETQILYFTCHSRLGVLK